MRVSILDDEDNELEVEVDGLGIVTQVFRVLSSGRIKQTRHILTDRELEEVATAAGLDDVEQE